jgi:hypothetical membrane protein
MSPKNAYLLFMLLFWLSWGIISYIAALKFPVPYQILNNHISNLGGIEKNPDGHMFWNFSMFFLGLISIPYYLFLARYFAESNPSLSRWMLWIGFGCVLGFALIGIFPEDIPGPHQMAAVLFLIGIPVLAIIIEYIVKKTPQIVRSPKFVSILNYLLWLLFAAMAIFFRLDEWFNFTFHLEPRVFDFPLWEWAYFLMVITWMIGILIPFHNTNNKNNNTD